MGRPKTNINMQLAGEAESALRQLENSDLSLRLMAIMQAGRRSVADVAGEFGVSSRTIFRWMNAFAQSGASGLRGRPRGHRQAKLDARQRQIIAGWLASGRTARGDSVQWTLEKLRSEIQHELGVEISIMPLWLHLQKMGFTKPAGRARATVRRRTLAAVGE